MRPDDEARAHDEGGVAEGFFDDPLAGRLARAVQLRVLVGLLPLRQLLDGSALHRRHALVRVHGDAGDEDVAAYLAAQHVPRAPGLVGHERGDVEHGVPLASLERRKVGGAVSPQLLHVREELRLGLSAVEQRRLVPLLERRIDERAPEEPRPAEDEDSHPG